VSRPHADRVGAVLLANPQNRQAGRGLPHSREEQLLILQELLASRGLPESRLKFFWLPQVIAFGYYQLSWLLYVVNPKWSYGLNADFEDHAEHEYMQWVADNSDWETEPFDSDLAEDYGVFDSPADLFRQIGHDERVHKQEASPRWTSHGSHWPRPRGGGLAIIHLCVTHGVVTS
jgi:hypothetical protein